ncbi:MAG: hypothetical protein EPN56_02265 [Rhodanobacter sp.]|nr:MAG: hypothetical protein EPN78_06565 [Rhodanobacter sp.]TAM14623.1 MAG: hypothetical protein EPN66_02030 [Rhodanobacter sp.]TAM37415.1 MAG: hypothetical protein EPN56_02265 [Rhodanobacter sp.]
MSAAVEIIEATGDAELCRALEAGQGWLVGLTRQPDGTLEDVLIVRNRKSGFLAAIPASDAERFSAGLPFAVGTALREAAARIRAEVAE